MRSAFQRSPLVKTAIGSVGPRSTEAHGIASVGACAIIVLPLLAVSRSLHVLRARNSKRRPPLSIRRNRPLPLDACAFDPYISTSKPIRLSRLDTLLRDLSLERRTQV